MHLSFRTRALRTRCESLAAEGTTVGNAAASLRARLADLRAAEGLTDLPLGYEQCSAPDAARLRLEPSGWIELQVPVGIASPIDRAHRLIVTHVEGTVDAGD